MVKMRLDLTGNSTCQGVEEVRCVNYVHIISYR